MAKIENVGNENDKNNKAEEHANFSQQEEEASEQVGLSKTDTRTREEIEEELQLNARLGLLELDVVGKTYFKPKEDGRTYYITFNREEALAVRGTPSEKFTREVRDYKTGTISKVAATQWVHTITHENGYVQTWNVMSKDLQGKIVTELMKKFSTIELRKEKTGERSTEVKYYVKGVR